MRRKRESLRGKQGLPSSGTTFIRSGRVVCAIAAIAALVLLPIQAGHAGWLSDMFKGSSKAGKSSRHAARPKSAVAAKHIVPPKRHTVKLAALSPAGLP